MAEPEHMKQLVGQQGASTHESSTRLEVDEVLGVDINKADHCTRSSIQVFALEETAYCHRIRTKQVSVRCVAKCNDNRCG
jgi:hypothetical protein